MQSEAPTIEPGIYPDMDWPTYHNAKRLNGSLIVVGWAESMKHLRWAIDNPKPDTPAMAIGRARHAALFEHDRFLDQYQVAEHDGRTKAGKEERAAAREAGKELIKLEDVNRCVEAASEALANPQIADLLSTGQPEVSMFASEMDMPTKGRVDWLRDDAIVDLKTTTTLDPDKFWWTFARLGYHLKLGFYRRMVQQLTGNRLPVYVIAQEQEAPYDCTRFEVHESILDWGEQLAMRTVARVKWCKQHQRWPGRCEDGDEYPTSFPERYMPDEEVVFDG